MTCKNLDTKLINAPLGGGQASLRGLVGELNVSVTIVSNHLQDLEDEGATEGYTPRTDYDTLGYDVTAVIQLRVEGSVLPEIIKRLHAEKQIISVYEVTGDYDIIAIGKFRDTDDMNTQIKKLLTGADIRESNTSIVFNAVTKSKRFDLDLEE